MHIPFNDLKAQHAALAKDLEAAALRVLRAGWYILGPEVSAFEAEFAAWLGLPAAAPAVGVNSGTDALLLALLACDIGPGAEVITVAHTAVATVTAIVNSGAQPVLVDIEADTFTLDPARLAAALTPATRAIIPVHLYGQPADLAPILTFARQHNLRVIEDCAQAHGARYQDRPVGVWGDLACFSFYPTKNLGAAGDGGMVVTRNADLAERVRLLRQYGWRERYISDVPGLNSRLDELQAALLRVKLRHLDDWNHRRRMLAARYDELLADACVTTPTVAPGNKHVYHLYVVRSQQRDALQAHLAAHGIATAIQYPVPIHKQPAYRHLAPPPSQQEVNRLIETERAAAEVLSLPLYPQLPIEHLDRVAAAIAQFTASS